MHIGPHVNSCQIFEKKISNIIFPENPYSESRGVPKWPGGRADGRTDGRMDGLLDGQT
jgi:hypothetical protein